MRKKTFPGANLISNVRAMFTPDKKKSVFDDQAFFGGASSGKSFNTKSAQLKAYEQIAWVSIAVDALARDAGSREYYFIDERTSEVKDNEQLPSDLLMPFENGFAGLPFSGGLVPIIVAHRSITGNAFFFMTQKSAYGLSKGVVEQFIPLNPSKVKTIISEDETQVVGYEVTLGQRTYNLPPENILHFKQSCIYSPFNGTGNITKMRLTAEGELAGEEFNNEFMKRRATPSLFIKDEESRNADEFKRTLSLLRNSYEGVENSGRLLFLSGKGVDAKPLQISQKDIQFLETKAFNRQTILSMFGVPPSVAGIPEGVSYAAAGIFRLNYLESTINPLLTELENAINLGFMKTRFPGLLFKFKKYPTGDLTAIKDQINNGIITPNRGAELMGESADYNDEARNSFYLPSNLLPISAGPAKEVVKRVGEKAPCACGHDHAPEKKTDEQTKDLISNPDNVEAICDYYEKKLPTNRKHQVEFLRLSLSRRKMLTKKYEAKLGDFFIEQGKRINENLVEFYNNNVPKGMKIDPQKMISFAFDLNLENDELSDVAKPLHTAGVTGAVSDINGLTSGTVQSSMANPAVKQAVQRCGNLLIKTHALNETTLAKLQDVISDWLLTDQNIQTLTADVGAMFEADAGWRARRIARTESRIAWDQGASVNYKDQGVGYVDVVGCESFEANSDCGRTGVPIDQAASLVFHPNHIGAIVPAEKTGMPSETPEPTV